MARAAVPSLLRAANERAVAWICTTSMRRSETLPWVKRSDFLGVPPLTLGNGYYTHIVIPFNWWFYISIVTVEYGWFEFFLTIHDSAVFQKFPCHFKCEFKHGLPLQYIYGLNWIYSSTNMVPAQSDNQFPAEALGMVDGIGFTTAQLILENQAPTILIHVFIFGLFPKLSKSSIHGHQNLFDSGTMMFPIVSCCFPIICQAHP